MAILDRILNQTECLQQYKNFDERCYLSSILVKQIDKIDAPVKN